MQRTIRPVSRGTRGRTRPHTEEAPSDSARRSGARASARHVARADCTAVQSAILQTYDNGGSLVVGLRVRQMWIEIIGVFGFEFIIGVIAAFMTRAWRQTRVVGTSWYG